MAKKPVQKVPLTLSQKVRLKVRKKLKALRPVLRSRIVGRGGVGSDGAKYRKLMRQIEKKSFYIDPLKPSWRVELHRQRAHFRRFTEERSGMLHPVREVSRDKIEWRQTILNLNIPDLRVPDVYGQFDSIHEIPVKEMPDNFVIKAVSGSGSVGVFPLIRRGEDSYYDFIECTELPFAKIADRHESRVALRPESTSQHVYVEELLVEPERPLQPAIDWKVFVCAGEVLAIMERLATPKAGEKKIPIEFRYFDADWNDIHPLQAHSKINNDLPLPRHPETLLKVAVEIANSFPLVMARVDLYDLPDGIVYGEFTPNAGGNYYMPRELDQMLGNEWQKGATRFEAMLLKRLKEAGHPMVGRGVWKP